MSASMTQQAGLKTGFERPPHHAANMQVPRDMVVQDDRYRDLRRPRKLKFFVNGDRYFRGKKLHVTPNRYYNFNDLLNDLTGKLPSNLNLPYGVRQIFTPVSGRRIFDIEDLSDGETYVCAGFEGFKMIKYGRAELEPWSMARPLEKPDPAAEGEQGTSYKYRGYASNAFHPGRYFRTNQSYQQRRWPGTFGNQQGGPAQQGQGQNTARAPGQQHAPAPGQTGAQSEQYGKPKVITIVRQGAKPRHNVKILLNRRSVQSYEQLVSDISEAFGPRYRMNKVRKLMSVRGREVNGVSDFFRDDDCFIAMGVGESQISDSDVADILEELFPEPGMHRGLMKEWQRAGKKRARQGVSPTGQSVKSQGQAVNKGHVNNVNNSEAQDKRDSGFDSSDAGTNRSEVGDQDKSERRGGGGEAYRSKKNRGRDRERAGAEDKTAENQSEEGGSPPPHGYYLMRKLEKERMKVAQEEKERSKRRQQKMVEAEKRAIDEERRKRGLVPLKSIDNPFKKNDDAAKEQQKEEARRKKEEEKKKREEAEAEKVRKDKEDRENAEAAARARMEKAQEKEKAEEKEKLEKDKADREKKELERREKAEKEKKKPEKGDKSSRKDEKADKAALKATKDKDKNSNEAQSTTPRDSKPSEKDTGKPDAKPTAQEEPKPDQKEEKPSPAVEPAVSEKPPEDAVIDTNNNNKTKEKRSTKDTKEKPQQPGPEDKSLRKRAKTKIVRRTKEERQVSGDDYILARYELGRKLGDGNFAIVRQSRKKETGQDFAIKVIDKAKLKGKEHMVENEIDIMKDCAHSNIVRLYEEYETTDRIYLVMELVKGGDLFDAITQSVKFGEPESSLMVKDLCSALFYMHSRSIVHRDLKPENLLVHRNKDGSITLKLADFGLAMEVKELIYTVCGTPTYVAPEILTEIGYGLEVDMWAVGVITYILLCGFPPFRSPDRNQTELFEFIKGGEYEFLSPYWDNTSKKAKDLISRLLVVDRRKRYSAIDVLSHPWTVTKGQTDILPDGSVTVDMACKDVRHDLETQAKQMYQSYQKLKEKKKRERDKGEEE